MASSNVNKFVQSNKNFKPWMLSKNTNEIVNSYIQKFYKQMPSSFKRDMKTMRVAAPKPENRGPLSTLKNLERQLPLATITPRNTSVRKSNSKLKQQHNSLISFLKLSSKNNQQMAKKLVGTNLTPSKRLLKTPNYKIYKSQRYGSSSSSSHSSLWRRYDEKKRQKQSPAQVNYLLKSFHTSRLEPAYGRYLMPLRNQQLQADLGSIPDAVKFSNIIIKDLMAVDKFTRNKVSAVPKRSDLTSVEHNANILSHAAATSKQNSSDFKDSAIKQVQTNAERIKRKAKLSPEHRDYARVNVSRVSQLKHPKPPNELFTAQHDRSKTELHEKHRRNRMKKLSLVENSSGSEREREISRQSEKQIDSLNEKPNENELKTEQKNVIRQAAKKVAALSNQKENKTTDILQKTKQIKDKTSNNLMPSRDLSSATSAGLPEDNAVSSPKPKGICGTIPKRYSIISPTVAATAQMSNETDINAHHYKRSDFFGIRKY